MRQIDLEGLKHSIRKMTRETKLYRMLKEELTALGYWKCKARGNPQAGWRKGFGKNKATLSI